MNKSLTIQGGCLCGKVRYEIASPLLAADHCHCSMCRRQHGAAFSTYADFKAGDFAWTTGEELIKVYETATGAGWVFCNECGSTLAATEGGTVSSISLGTVNGDVGIHPESHIYVGSKASWYTITDDLQQFDERSSSSK